MLYNDDSNPKKIQLTDSVMAKLCPYYLVYQLTSGEREAPTITLPTVEMHSKSQGKLLLPVKESDFKKWERLIKVRLFLFIQMSHEVQLPGEGSLNCGKTAVPKEHLKRLFTNQWLGSSEIDLYFELIQENFAVCPILYIKPITN